ncbi:MAG: NAD+ synthase [Betaproteobacteria bacterium]|nr:NAD+ synthase [Betaproteobacteria bacterium]
MVKVAWAQVNPTVGDLEGNSRLILDAAQEAVRQGAQVLVAPELILTGYPPEDLLLRPTFLQACMRQLSQLALDLQKFPDLTVVVGHPVPVHRPPESAQATSRSFSGPVCFNAASVLVAGRVVGEYHKRELPNYQVFDERRYFQSGREAGSGPLVFTAGGLRFGVLICEDAWLEEPARAAKAAGAQALLVLNASPFHLDKEAEREARMSECARANQLPLVYSHLIGGQDELVFDGASFAVDCHGTVQARSPSFSRTVQVVDISAQGQVTGELHPLEASPRRLWNALVMGTRDYVEKNRFPGVLIGLSGGIDSALVLAVAVDALGPDRVRAVMMPSPYTADISWIDAAKMAQGLGVRYDEIPIRPMMEAFSGGLKDQFHGLPEDTTEENIQARIRGTLLMALSNKTGALVLTTGNKSEMATGYCTLYGDMAGGFAVIKDLPKTAVYRLAEWRNRQPFQGQSAGNPEVIPSRIITRAPSAELRPDQTDQDSLPPYEVLDGILARYMEENLGIEDIVGQGFERSDVERVVRLIKINEYKRRQAPVGIRVSHRSFGRDWRYPIVSKFRG